ncbi:DUF4011 domain-containing protein [Microbacterium sp. NPDC076911]|uniref:DUF4011 domain-containing protein n=1 Tax=Microbacterium sp. NPDC076911 TaxID=3154958 RepID=UPI003438388C
MSSGGAETARLQNAVKSWRESLILLSGRNRLLNYRPTRSSTLEFTRATADDIIAKVSLNRGVPVVGLLPPTSSAAPGPADTADLEGRALDVIEDFEYDAFPDHLFVNKTQRDVDRGLKTLASTASREFLDRGLSVLYLALGSLHWQELNGDARVSPLVFLPVELRSDGPKRPQRVFPSNEDMVVNPALDIRLREHGVFLPDQATIESLMAEGGVAAVEAIVGSLDLPKEWHVEPLCVLSAFMFAKEAMFRDLEANEDKVLASSLVQALAGGSDEVRERLVFAPADSEDIDTIAPPEQVPLILDADSSQRVAIAAAANGRSFVLDGPPGTGKSQTIANIIATLVSDGKRVLFVSEKAVALDVVRDRLAARGLAPLLFELHSHKATRAEVAKSLGQALSEKPTIVEVGAAGGTERVMELRQALTAYASAMNERRGPIEWSLHEALGKATTLPKVDWLPRAVLSVSSLTPSTWDRISDLGEAIGKSWNHVKLGERHLWHGIQELAGLEYDVGAARRALEDLVIASDTVSPQRGLLGLAGTNDWQRLESLAVLLHEGDPDWQDKAWVATASREELDSLRQLLEDADHALQADRVASEHLGAWRLLAGMERIPEASANLKVLFQEIETSPISVTDERAELVLTWLEKTRELAERAATLASALGLQLPRYMGDLGVVHELAAQIYDSPPLVPSWLTGLGVASLVKSLDELEDSQRAERAASEASNVSFLPSISDIDVTPINDRWDALPGWRRAIVGPSAEDRKSIAPHARVKPRAAVGLVNAALAWQEARQRRDRAAIAVNDILSFVPSDDSTWAAARHVVARAEYVLARNGEPNAATLRETQASTFGWQAIGRSIDELAQLIVEHKSLARAVGPVVDDDSRPIAETTDLVGRLLAEAQHALAAARPFADQGARSLQLARQLQADADTAGEMWRSTEAAVVQLNKELPGLGTQITVEWQQETARRAEWTLALRKSLGDVDRSPMLPSLATIAWSDSLSAAGGRWDSARSTLMKHFGREVYRTELDDPDDAASVLKELADRLDEAHTLSEARVLQTGLRDFGLGDVIDALAQSTVEAADVANLVRAATLSAWLIEVESSDSRLRSKLPLDRDTISAQFRELDRALVDQAAARVLSNSVRRRPTTPSAQTALIMGEAEKKKRHIPVRDLIARSRDVIQAIHPCFMMSPLAVSQYLPPDIEFDVVIFDEASQVPPGDAINCIYRARAVIAAGDQKQLPPTAFFASAQSADDDLDAEEDLANDYESLLDLMKSSGAFTSISLRWHYRSRHEHLIAYSNNSFYGDRLVTFPGALDVVPDAGVKLLKVDGTYRRSQGQDNPKEALFVAGRMIHHLDTRQDKSLGVVAMSAAQRDAISNALLMKRAERPDLDEQFVESRLDGIFIKSLEEVQGDERDVIIMSVGYGPDETGTVYRNFGPINKKGGERRLNVAVTRAKELIEVVSSMSAGDIGDIPSAGGRHLRRYLDYAERGPVALAMELGSEGLGTDSPFEDAVISSIRSWGYDVQPQVGVSGFRIDIGVKHPQAPGVFMLGVECDGAMYHSSKTARDRDRLRHEILEGLGWHLHHIWGTDWYRNREREEARLEELLQTLQSMEPTGRLGQRRAAPAAPVIAVESQEFDVRARPDWMKDYIPYRAKKLRALDWTDSSNARHLVPFIEAVVDAEGPVHIETIKARLREHSDLERVNKHALRTVDRAIDLADVTVDDLFVRKPRRRIVEARVAGGRTIQQVHDAEFRLVVVRMLETQAGPTRDDMILAVARGFGWLRTPSEAGGRVNAVIDELRDEGVLSDADGILRVRT